MGSRNLFYCILCALSALFVSWGPAGAQSQEPSQNLFEALSHSGFTLKRALSGPDKGEAAAFSFLRTAGKDTVFTADFALSWSPRGSRFEFDPFDLSLQTSVEGKLTSDESEAEDAWRLRASIIGDTSQLGIFDSTYTSLSAKFESDQDLDTQKLTGELLFTPTLRRIALGKGWPPALLDPSGRVKRYPPLQFLWRPFIGLDVGHTVDKGESAETEDTVLRLIGRGRAQILLNFFAQAMGLREASIFVDNTFYFLPLEDKDDTHNFLVAGLQFQVTKDVTIGLTYKVGEEAPNFEKIETFGATIGIRF